MHEVQFSELVQSHKDAWDKARNDIVEAIRIEKSDCKKRRKDKKSENSQKSVHVLPVATLCKELGIVGEKLHGIWFLSKLKMDAHLGMQGPICTSRQVVKVLEGPIQRFFGQPSTMRWRIETLD